MLKLPPPPRAFTFLRARRLISSASSSTSIKAISSIDGNSHNGVRSQLAEDLQKLSRAGFVGDARARLALRGLAEGKAPVRVAGLLSFCFFSILGLMKEGGGAAAGHGPPSEISRAPGSPLSVLTYPSPFLRGDEREILLARMPPPSGSGDPTDVTIPTSRLPGAGVLHFPVHRCILWSGEGVSGVNYLLRSHHQPRPSSSQLRVLNLISIPGLSRGGPPPPEAGIGIVDLAAAERAVSVRKGAGEEAEFLKMWRESGMKYVTEWMSWGVEREKGGEEVKPAVKLLISAIISEAEGAIRRREEKDEAESWEAAASGQPDTVAALKGGLKVWAERAHGELQKRLEEAWEMRLWRSLEWWKLPWTVDDVAGNAREVVEAGLLPEAKREFLLLAGRMAGAGYRGPGGVILAPTSTPEKEEPPQAGKHSQNLHETGGPNTHSPPPLPPLYPPYLFSSTSHVLESLIPALHSSATTLLVQSLSTSLTSLAASILLYLSDIPAYSSCTAGAIGVVLSMRFLQTRWAKAQGGFQAAVKEHGRMAIVECERWGWEVLRSGAPARDGNVDREAWNAVQRARKGVEAL